MTDANLIGKYLKYSLIKIENIHKYYSYSSHETQKLIKELISVFSVKMSKDVMFFAIKEYIKNSITKSF